jgi:hypothetical protein
MPIKPRQLTLRKPSRTGLAEAGRMANENPDKLARNLLKSRTFANSRQHKYEIWSLLQNLGSDAAIKRASTLIPTTRSTAELQAILNAADADMWSETAPAIVRRFASELNRLAKRAPSKDATQRIETLCTVGAKFAVQFETAHLRKLLKHSSAKLRAMGAAYVFKMKRTEFNSELLQIAGSQGPGAPIAIDAICEFGDASSAAVLWPKALIARKSGQTEMLPIYFHMLGALGAFDCMLALRVWIEEDFSKSEDAGWPHAEAWCAFVHSKLAAGDYAKADALSDLRWFKHVAERSAVPEARMEGEGVFHLARSLMVLGAEDEAEKLVQLAVKRSLPNPDRFPTLLPAAVRAGGGTLAPTVWLAVSGDLAAQRKIVENWPVLLRDGRKPLNWEMRSKLDTDVLRDTLSEALRCETPGAARHVLKFVCGDAAAVVIRDEVEKLAIHHISEVVRWKAARTLAAIDFPAPALVDSALKTFQRWTRLDALVLSGATKISETKRAPKSAESAPVGPGMVPPEREGRGWTLIFDTLRAPARRNIAQALINGPLSRALHRRAPFGPAFEERPDVKAVREMAPPKNSLDEQMAEMAKAVMDFWVYGDEFLTLDLNGVAQVAAFLSSNGVTMDDDDVTACGAFIGEAIRKRMGGEWTGFDGNYRLEIGAESFDPIGMAKILFERKDPFHGPLLASETFVSAESRLNPEKRKGAPRDTGASFERAIKNLCELPHTAPMSELMAETRVFSYRMEPGDWPAVLAACDPLLENASGARIAAAICIYAPGDALARAWARWGARRRETSGLTRFMAEAMATAGERDDLEAMPDWTVPVPASRFSFLNSLRKRATAADWRKILMLLMRQRTAAGDLTGVSWCLFSYKYEYPDSLALVRAFCAMTVSARQTLVRATRHCTRDEVKLFRPLWAEALRDPSPAVVLAGLEAAGFNRAKSLRPLAEALKNDERLGISIAATAIVDGLNTK